MKTVKQMIEGWKADILEHLIDVNDRNNKFDTMLHVIKDTERHKAGPPF